VAVCFVPSITLRGGGTLWAINWRRGTAFPCVSLHYNHCVCGRFSTRSMQPSNFTSDHTIRRRAHDRSVDVKRQIVERAILRRQWPSAVGGSRLACTNRVPATSESTLFSVMLDTFITMTVQSAPATYSRLRHSKSALAVCCITCSRMVKTTLRRPFCPSVCLSCQTRAL